MEKTVAEIEKIRKDAERGNGIAQFMLGLLYAKGNEVEQDYKKALKWYEKAALQEIPEAQFSLGVMYEYGIVVEQDFQTAFKWYGKAARLKGKRPYLGTWLYREQDECLAKDYQQLLKCIKKVEDKLERER